MSDRGLHLVGSSREGAVESLLAPVLWCETAQEHVILARYVSNHKKTTKRALRTLHSYCMQHVLRITGAYVTDLLDTISLKRAHAKSFNTDYTYSQKIYHTIALKYTHASLEQTLTEVTYIFHGFFPTCIVFPSCVVEACVAIAG